MNRIEVLRQTIDRILLTMSDIEERRYAYVHLYGVAQSCAFIALKRGENAELAIMAGMLHDIYSYAKMDKNDHGHKGAVLAREILEALQLTNRDETELICTAIDTHSEKELRHSPFQELLKDADVLQHFLYNPLQDNLPHDKNRYEALKTELGIESDTNL